jgi:hypothetical protein
MYYTRNKRKHVRLIQLSQINTFLPRVISCMTGQPSLSIPPILFGSAFFKLRMESKKESDRTRRGQSASLCKSGKTAEAGENLRR